MLLNGVLKFRKMPTIDGRTVAVDQIINPDPDNNKVVYKEVKITEYKYISDGDKTCIQFRYELVDE